MYYDPSGGHNSSATVSAATVSEIRFNRTIIGTLGAPLQHGEDVDRITFKDDDDRAVEDTNLLNGEEASRRTWQAEGIEVSADPMAHGLALPRV